MKKEFAAGIAYVLGVALALELYKAFWPDEFHENLREWYDSAQGKFEVYYAEHRKKEQGENEH